MEGLLLTGSVALVTAGSSGIGSAVCRALALHGSSVAVHYRSDRRGAVALSQELRSMGRRSVAVYADLLKEHEVIAMVAEAQEALGDINLLVNNASVFLPPAPVETVPWEDMQAEFEGSVRTAFHVTQAVLPGMLTARDGVIVNIIGTMTERPATGYAAHIAGKGALQALTLAMAKELAPRGVSVHAVSPGLTLTPNVLATTPDDVRESIRSRTPTRRLTTPDDLAGLVVFLASDLARSATGLRLHGDGGLAELGG
jgi:3-oxoacyl-[acyl-carrier protein] reductase